MRSLAADIDLIRQICDHQPESVLWLTPVWDETAADTIVDFCFQYCNTATELISGRPNSQLVGKQVRRSRLPDPTSVDLTFDQCLQVYKTGQPITHTFFSKGLNKYLHLHRTKVQDGVLTTVRNRTEEYQTGLEKEQQAKLLQSLVENSPYGICLYESIRNAANEIIDFRPKICNKRSSELTALPLHQLYSNTAKELMMLRGQTHFFDILKRIVETGEAQYFQHYVEDRDQWLGISIVKFEDGYLLNYIDITENQRLALQAAQNADELDAIFNGSISGVYAAKVVRNEKGRVVDLVFLRANASFHRIFRTTPEQINGKSLLAIAGDESQGAFIGYANEVMTTGVSAIHVLNYHNPERWFEFSMVKLQEEVITITINDITAQRLATLKIEEQKNLLDSILKFSPNGLAITQAIRDTAGEMVDARCVLMNDACEKYNGMPNEVMLANSFATLSPELLETALFKEATRLKTGDAFRTEYQVPQTGKWIELAIAKMDKERFINVFTDITEVKEAQLHLEQLVEELKRSNSNLEDFAYAASHDLKEPIRKIRVFSEQLRTKYAHQLDEAGQRTFERLEVAAARMNGLIEDLLLYAHVNQGIEHLEEVDLNVKVQKAIEDLELSIEEKGARVRIGDLPVVRGNKRQLQQLFQNLIGNAIKYGKPGLVPEVWISAEVRKGKDSGLQLPTAQLEARYHAIRVKDNGIGFEQKDADRIFNVFTRLHSGGEYKGTGVGLSIVRKVVENHKGFMRVESSPGAGASFTVYLPVP